MDELGEVIPATESLEVVESFNFNYLGVVLDNFLKYNLHVDKITASVGGIFRSCSRIINLQGLEDSRKAWFYVTVIRPYFTYACAVWALLTPAQMGRITHAEYQILRALFGEYRRSNGRYVSYRSRLIRARIPRVDYQIIKLTRRHLVKLDGMDCARVRQDRPNWIREMHLIRNRLLTTESTMFIDALGLFQDTRGVNVFYTLDRSGLAGEFDLGAALDVNNYRRRHIEPTEFDLKTIRRDEPRWLNWQIPQRYRDSYSL